MTHMELKTLPIVWKTIQPSRIIVKLCWVVVYIIFILCKILVMGLKLGFSNYL